jgi:hypothetical protein
MHTSWARPISLLREQLINRVAYVACFASNLVGTPMPLHSSSSTGKKSSFSTRNEIVGLETSVVPDRQRDFGQGLAVSALLSRASARPSIATQAPYIQRSQTAKTHLELGRSAYM